MTLELADALQTSRGRAFLSEQGVSTDLAEFTAQLRPPVRRDLAIAAGMPPAAGSAVVYTAQQLCVDYRHSVVAKLRTLARLTHDEGVAAALIWSDVDRSGSDKAMTTIRWPIGETMSVSLAARSTRKAEVRFVELEEPAVRESWRRLGAWLEQSVTDSRERRAAMSRHAALGAKLASTHTLAEANRALTDVLLTEGLNISLPGVAVSKLLDHDLVTASVERLLDQIDHFIAAFNEGIQQMQALGFNPQVRPRSPDYLPLYYSCPDRPDRVPLFHVRSGSESVAVAACSVHGSHRFSLGRGERSLAELAATGRWSPDVTLPLFLQDLASGVVAGRSSALYGVVLGWAQRKVLGTDPCPVLVPEELGNLHSDGSVDSVLFSYLTGGGG